MTSGSYNELLSAGHSLSDIRCHGLSTQGGWRNKKRMSRILAVSACLLVTCHVFGSSTVRCKYSVRDVAFVNVHGKAWQLQLTKTDEISPSKFLQWNEMLRAKLEGSNVGYVWVEPGSKEANRPGGSNETKDSLPPMALIGMEGMSIPVSTDSNGTFNVVLDSVLNSPAREEILTQVVDSLCVFVIVESGNEQLDGEARATVAAAIEQLKKQMWTLEKPAEKEPAMVTILNAEQRREKWLLQSIGIDPTERPAVAIIYGQGRRLGEVLVGGDIQQEKLVGRASVCGQDCECDLNRDWLYGIQMIHRWDKQRERAAELSLSFDPRSAFVIAEVAQIMQKNGGRNFGQNSGQPRVDLGGGLIIHDLDRISNPEKSMPPNSGKRQGNQVSEREDKKMERNKAMKLEDTGMDVAPGVSIPWTLFVGLAAVSVIVFVYRLGKWYSA